MHPIVFEPPDLSVVDRRVHVAARRLVRRWVVLLASAAVCTATGVVAFLLMLADPVWRSLALWVLWYPAAGLFVLYQLMPKRAPQEPYVELPGQVAEDLADWLHERTRLRWQVRLTPGLELWVRGEVIYVGMPAAAGLSDEELVRWVQDALAHRQATRGRLVGLALLLSEGALGRGLWGRRDARLSRWLLRGLDRRRESFLAQLATHADARRHLDPSWVELERRLEVVDEAWQHVVDRWLGPALRRGAWHADPYSGLALFLGACEISDLLEPTSRPRGALPVLASLPSLTTVESEVAMLLVAGHEIDEDPIEWEEQPTEVTVAAWRVQLNEGLRAAALATGSTVPATFDAAARVFGGGEEDVSWVLPRASSGDLATASPAAGAALLRSTALLALVESGNVRPSWEWPWGTVLRDGQGELVADVPETGDADALRQWLAARGVDTSAPLWLAEGEEPGGESPQLVMDVWMGWRRREVVLTDQGIRVLPGSPGLTRSARRYLDGPLAGPEPVSQMRDFTGLDGLRWDDVVGASMRPRTWAPGWRLLLWSEGSNLRFRGLTGTRAEEHLFETLLGDRLQVRWSHRRPALRRARAWLRFVCLAIGGLAAAVAAVSLVRPPPGEDSTPLDWIEFGLAGLGVVLLGLAPDVVAGWSERRRARQLKRRVDVVDPASAASAWRRIGDSNP